METSTKHSVSFECRSTVEAQLICNAVNRYGRAVLKAQGVDLRNYAPASAEGAGFGWDAVQRAARDMGNGTTTHMSRRMAVAIRTALEDKAEGTTSPDSRTLALALAGRMADAILRTDRRVTAVSVAKATDEPCEGCGAAAGKPCNPHMACQETAQEQARNSVQVIGGVI